MRIIVLYTSNFSSLLLPYYTVFFFPFPTSITLYLYITFVQLMGLQNVNLMTNCSVAPCNHEIVSFRMTLQSQIW